MLGSHSGGSSVAVGGKTMLREERLWKRWWSGGELVQARWRKGGDATGKLERDWR